MNRRTPWRRAPASWIVALAVRLLPTDHRDRYRAELAAELREVPRRRRLAYAVRVLACSHALRAALAGAEPVRHPELAVPGWPHRRRWCRARLHHRWATVSVEGSTVRYRQCQACGQEYAFASRGRPLPPPRVF